MNFRAYGKINLSLDITGILENGYHSVSMVMQSVELSDIVNINKNETGKITVKTDNPDIPDGEANLAYKACELMKKEFDISCGFDIFIEKHIPVAGGMAGGSSDAAAVIRGINEICALDASIEKLMKIGLSLGADVPFCIQIKPALAEGIGEILTKVSGLCSELYILIVNPGSFISTKEVYQKIDATKRFNIVDNRSLIQAPYEKDLDRAKLNMKNVMQEVTTKLCPKVDEIISSLYSNGAKIALMSGSGATCYGVFSDEKTAITARNKFKNYFTAITKPLE